MNYFFEMLLVLQISNKWKSVDARLWSLDIRRKIKGKNNGNWHGVSWYFLSIVLRTVLEFETDVLSKSSHLPIDYYTYYTLHTRFYCKVCTIKYRVFKIKSYFWFPEEPSEISEEFSVESDTKLVECDFGGVGILLPVIFCHSLRPSSFT